MTVTETTTDVHAAGYGELPEVITALSRGFFGDRIFRWIMPDDERRRESLPNLFSLFAGAFWPHGGVYTAAAGTGAALWLPPGRQLVAGEEAEEFERRTAEVSGTDAARMAEVIGLLDENHPHDDCWYLNLIGVDPVRQGRGIGSALLRAVLHRADRDGMPAYVEATSPENRRLYERHGFRTTRELTVSDCPPLFAMWREPQATSRA